MLIDFFPFFDKILYSLFWEPVVCGFGSCYIFLDDDPSLLHQPRPADPSPFAAEGSGKADDDLFFGELEITDAAFSAAGSKERENKKRAPRLPAKQQ